jgi:hypothetical protein
MKTSFILHIDSLCVLDKMTNEQAGIFIKALYQYQTTKVLPELDIVLQMAAAPFINQFIRDDKDYKKVCDRNRKNGEKGGRKKRDTKTQRTHSVQVGLNVGGVQDSEEKNQQNKTAKNPKNPVAPYKEKDSDSDKEKDTMPFGVLELDNAWQEWIVFRKEKKNPLTPTAIKKQLKFLKKHSPQVALAIIEKSIVAGWTGLFDLKEPLPQQQVSTPESEYQKKLKAARG